MPCETQQPITDLSASTGGPPAQESSNLAAPGADLRWDSAAASGLGQISNVAGQNGLKLGTAAMPAMPASTSSGAGNSAKRSAK